MSKVYIIVESSYYDSDYSVLGVYDSLDKAKTNVEIIKLNYPKGGWIECGWGWKNDDYEWRLDVLEQEVE
jgi:hypothetical protein